jgi:hypothetical protein
MTRNPFKAGDLVVYRPSAEGRGKVIVTDMASLQPGQRYRVIRVEEDAYLVLEGFEASPSGGLYWTEFEPDRPTIP